MSKRKSSRLTQKTLVAAIKRRDPRLLGRKFKPDPRDHDFKVKRPLQMSNARSKTWVQARSAPWDQGQTSRCTSFGTNGLLAAAPVRNNVPPSPKSLPSFVTGLPAKPTLEEWLNWFYGYTKQNDEWPGEDYEGSSVRGAMKALQNLGYISSYYWAFDIDTIVNYVLTTGPMVVGTDWTESMFETIGTGKFKNFIQVSPDGEYKVAGGHCYLILGVNRDMKCPDGSVGAFLILNSWGRLFGLKGRAWISFKDFGILLQNQGEAACVTEMKLAA